MLSSFNAGASSAQGSGRKETGGLRSADTASCSLMVTSLQVTLTALASPLSVVLKGPSGDVKADKTIALDATSSSDPDDPHVSIESQAYHSPTAASHS